MTALRWPHGVLLVARLGRVRHGRFEKGLVVAACLDELFVQLREVICGNVSMEPPRTRNVRHTLLLRVLLDQLDQLRPNGQRLVVQFLSKVSTSLTTALHGRHTEISSFSSSFGAELLMLSRVSSFSTFLISANTSASI